MTKALVALAIFLGIASIFWLVGLHPAVTVVAFDLLLVATLLSYWFNWPKPAPKGFRKLKHELDEDIKRFNRTGKM